jgi:hypothetical protein
MMNAALTLLRIGCAENLLDLRGGHGVNGALAMLVCRRLIFGILQRANKRLALFFIAKGDVFQKTFGSHCPHLLKSG